MSQSLVEEVLAIEILPKLSYCHSDHICWLCVPSQMLAPWPLQTVEEWKENVVCPGKCRAQFVPQMVNSLTKLGMAQGGSNLENRSLAIDLCGVMVLWEERRIKELQSGATQVCSLTKSAIIALAP